MASLAASGASSVAKTVSKLWSYWNVPSQTETEYFVVLNSGESSALIGIHYFRKF
jgi:hypothetical protein